MKKRHILTIALLSLVIASHGQAHLFLEEQEVDLEDTRSSAWVFPIYRDLDAALDDLKEYCKERSDVKMKKGGENVLIGEKVRIPSIADKRGDIIGYAYITENYYGMALVFLMKPL